MLNFALIADTHYAPRTEENNRFYNRSLDKINACLPLLQRSAPAFLMHMGDVVDVPHDPVGALNCAQQIWSALQLLQVPVWLTAGNHLYTRYHALESALGKPTRAVLAGPRAGCPSDSAGHPVLSRLTGRSRQPLCGLQCS